MTLERQYLLTCKNASDATYHSRCIHGVLVVWLLVFIGVALIPQIGQWWITVVVVGLVVAIVMVPFAMMLDRIQEKAVNAEQSLYKRYMEALQTCGNQTIIQHLEHQTREDLLQMNEYKKQLMLFGCYGINDLDAEFYYSALTTCCRRS